MENSGIELLSSTLTAGYINASLIEWLKHQPWFPLANVDASKLNRAFAVFMSVLTAIGIHHTFDVSSGVLTITGLTPANMLHGIWAVAQQFAFQQGAYKMMVKGSNGGSNAG